MEVPKIVITGAPGSAKTEFIERLKNIPDFSRFVFLDELARQLLSDNADLRHHPVDLHCEIYHRQVEREDKLNGQPFITDRGTIDGFAFHRDSMDKIGTDVETEHKRYTAVIHLGTAASLGEKYYQFDEVRQESPEHTLNIEKALIDMWSGHGNYHYIEPDADIENKFDRFVQLLKQLTLVEFDK